MKDYYFLTLIFILIFHYNSFGQENDAFNYQAVIRDEYGEILKNHELNLLFEIIEADTAGNVVYSEIHTAKTNTYGLVALEIGNGNPIIGDMQNIMWANTIMFVRVSIDLNQSGDYEGVSTSQLLPVPFALHAKYSSDSYWKKNSGSINFIDGNVGIGDAQPQNSLSISGEKTGLERTMVSINNLSNSSLNSAALEVKAGSVSNYTTLRMHSDNYSYSWWAKHGQLKTLGDGLIIEATKSDGLGGDIVFVNGQTGSTNVEKTVNMLIGGNGNVGIGTVNPEFKLDIEGSLNADGIFLNGEPLNLGQSLWQTNETATYYSAGNVGIGNAQPQNALSITGEKTGIERTMFSINNLSNSSFNSAALEVKAGSNSNYTTLRMHSDNYSYSWWARHGQLKTLGDGLIIEATKSDGTGGDIVFVNGETGGANVVKTVNMLISENGNVGIGTTNPDFKLDINGSLNADSIFLNGEPLNPNQNVWGANEMSTFYTDGYVGIGNTTPQKLLDVSLPSNGNEQNNGISINRNNGYLNLINGTMYQGHFQARISGKSTHDDSPGLVITATPNSDIVNSNAILLRGGEFNSLINSDVLRVQNYLEDLMTVKSDGNVGIGTTTPKSKLHVTNGDIYLEDASKGVIMTSPNGNCWRMTVGNDGNPSFSAIDCPQ